MTERLVSRGSKKVKTTKFKDLEAGDFYKLPNDKSSYIYFKMEVEVDGSKMEVEVDGSKMEVEVDGSVSSIHVCFSSLIQYDPKDWGETNPDVIKLSRVTLNYVEETV